MALASTTTRILAPRAGALRCGPTRSVEPVFCCPAHSGFSVRRSAAPLCSCPHRVIVPISAIGITAHPLHSPSLTSKAHAGDGLG